MGVFSQWQPAYAAHGIPTFPVRMDQGAKKPAVKGYLKLGPKVSEKLADKFSDVDAIGFALKRAKVTVLDVDTPEERVLADALDRHGPTPIIIRTGSGNSQAWYRNSGERRHVRPWSGLPIDVLGDGFTVAPPSKGAKGEYTIVQGTLDDLHRLPPIRGLDDLAKGDDHASAAAGTAAAPERIGKGERNNALFRFCMTQAHLCASEAELVELARAYAETALSPLPEPMPVEEVRGTAYYAWRKTERGENWFGQGKVALKNAVVDRLAASDPDAFALLAILQRHHGGKSDSFVVANAMHVSLGWTLPKFRAARERLLDEGFIRCVHVGGKGTGDPARYVWPDLPQQGEEREEEEEGVY